MPGDIERRESPRVRVKWPVSVKTENAIIQAETRNITVNGIFILSKDLLRLNEVFPLHISPPNRQPIEVAGMVIRSDHQAFDERNISYGSGICFVSVSDRDRHFLKDVISTHPR
jgi:hypothetical protein